MTNSTELELTAETEKCQIEIDFEYLHCVLNIDIDSRCFQWGGRVSV